MLRVAALEVGDPVLLIVLMKSDDRALHRLSGFGVDRPSYSVAESS
jgi:hypothetical protein